MKALSEFKGLITAGTFISVFILLASFIPTGLLGVDVSDYQIINIPEYFSGIDIQSFENTWNNFIDDGDIYSFLGVNFYLQVLDDGGGDFGGWDIELLSNFDQDAIFMWKVNYWWLFRTGFDVMSWTNEIGLDLGESLTKNILDLTYADYGRMEYVVSLAGQLEFKTYFEFNTTTYDTPSLAWANDELYVFCGIDVANVQTANNVWHVINQIVFFNIPEIHPLINYIIRIPFYVSIAYLVWFFIKEMLPF